NRERGSSGLVPAERHGGDVNAMFAQQRADATDHARTISIFEHQDNSMRPRFDRPRVNANDSWGTSEKCAAHRYILSFATGGKLEHVGVITGRAKSRLGNFQSQTFSKRRRVDFIHFVPAGALQKAFQD